MNVKIISLGKTNLVHLDDYGSYLNEYFQYIVKCFSKSINNSNIERNILIGNFNKNHFSDIKIDANIEHTLVKEGGRGSYGAPIGKVPCGDGFYLCRIDRINYLNSLDLIIDYSNPNIFNIQTSGLFPHISNKLIYISPIIFDISNFEIGNRSKTITMFIDTEQDRRKVFLENIKKKNIDCLNFQNIYTKEDLINFYADVKIMVNIHQTPHHHTFEELRVLGALVNGVIIISEDVPLKEEIPYSDYIIWCDYDNVYDKILEVQNNYEYYWNKIFNSDLKNILIKMEEDNISNISKKINNNNG